MNCFWEEYQHRRWMRPNAHLYVRPDAALWQQPNRRLWQAPNLPLDAVVTHGEMMRAFEAL